MGQGTETRSVPRCLLVLVTVTAGAGALIALLAPDLLELATAVRRGDLSGTPFDEVLVAVCEVAVTGCAAWLWLATAVVTTDAARGRRSRHRVVPGTVRRVVLAACGVTLVGGLGAPAHASDGAGTSPLDGLPLPDRATTTTYVSEVFAQAAPRHRADGRSAPQPAIVVVRPGDTLWAIARADLPAQAPDGAVAQRVREIHQANRAVIGTDPSLIRPDQRLRMPRPKTIREEHR
jgi:LysM domain